MSRRLVWVCVWALLIGCDDDQPPGADDQGPIDGSLDGAPEPDATPDPEPDAGPKARIRIVSPMAGARLTGADDLEGDADSGVRVAVTVEAEGADDGLVRITVDGLEYRAQVEGGRATAVVALPPAEMQRVPIEAMIMAGGAPVVDRIEVVVAVRRLALAVAPLPAGGCDFGADDDRDPEAPGIQSALVVTGEGLTQVEVQRAGGAVFEQPAEEGRAEVPLTFADGPVELTVVGRAPDALAGTIGPLVYTARSTAPTLDVQVLRGVANGIEQIDEASGRATWAFPGDSTGLAPGAALIVTWDPPLPGAAERAVVDDEGRFTVEAALPLQSAWAGRLTVAGADACGARAVFEADDVRLDAVRPVVRIVDPPDGRRLTVLDDVDPERLGVQVAFTVAVDDPRPDVGYRLAVWCAPPGEQPDQRSRIPSDASTRLEAPERPVIGTFDLDERGEVDCFVLAESAPNGAEEIRSRYRLSFDQPTFRVTAPAADAGCLMAPRLRVAGVGVDLDGNDPRLAVVAVGPDGVARDPIPLVALGDEAFAVELGPEALPDGAWTLRVEGTVFGGVPVTVVPAAIPVTLDREAPTLEVSTPAQPHLADDDPATAGFQTAVRARVCGAAGQTVRAMSQGLIEGAPYAVEAPVPAGDCAEVALPPFTAPLGPIRLTVRTADTCGHTVEVGVLTRIDPARIGASIIAPADGVGVDAALDDDPAPGCQFDLEGVIAGPGADARIAVCTTADQGRPDAVCLGADSALAGPCEVMGVADAGTTVRCPLTLVDGAHALTLVAQSNGRVESAAAQIVADCSPPTVAALVVEQDRDGDGCINRQERLDPLEPGDSARVRVAFAVEGVADGRTIRLRTAGGLDLGVATLEGGAGAIEATLPGGVHRLYLRGQDAVGNPLPEPGEAGVVLRAVEVDVRPPTPTLIGLDDGVCLSAADDVDPGQAGLQSTIRVQTGRAGDEAVTVAVAVDGQGAASRAEALDRIDFDLSLPEGPLDLTVTAADACGNVGSVAGFATRDGLPDWQAPRPVAVQVDSVAPGLRLVGVDAGAELDPADDADGDPGNGFQLDLMVEVDPTAPLEAGAEVELRVGAQPAVSAPSPLIVPEDFGGLLPARLTLAGGEQILTARATDACGNTGTSPAVPITVDVPGCVSRIVGFDDNPAVRPDAAPLTVLGEVDRIDVACIGAPVRLVIDGAAGPQAVVGPDGGVRFDGVALGEGAHALTLRVGPVRDVTLDSPVQRVIVDPIAPTVRITRPAGPDPAALLTDDRPDLDGQQTVVIAEVAEPRVDTARRARLTIGGRAAGEVEVPDESPATVEFRDVTVPTGRQTLEVCVIDEAANVGCGRRVVDADPSPPGTVAPVQVEIRDRRATEVAFTFAAPGDDAAGGGMVSGYALRRAATPFADEGDWAAAADTEVRLPAVAPPGAPETLIVRGPGPTLADGLALERLHAVAIRALDAAGRPGPLVSVEVDLRLRTASGETPAPTAPWAAGDLLNATSPVVGVGDVDGDGFDDLLISAIQGGDTGAVAFVFGAADPADFEVRAIDRAPGVNPMFFGAVGVSAGDLNGDGAPDVAIQGYNAPFNAVVVSLYFGCPAPCGRATVITPDAYIVTDGRHFTTNIAGVGDVWQPDGAGFDDLLIGGALGNENLAYVVAGRAEWPGTSDDSLMVSDFTPFDYRVTLLVGADAIGPTGTYAAGLGDLDGDGYDDIALSHGPDLNQSFIYYGGDWQWNEPVRYMFGDPDTVRLADPCGAANATFGTGFVGGVDLDGDPEGRPDFVVGNRANKRLVVFDADRQTLDCFGRSPGQYGRVFDLAGDVDGDGAVDIIATHGDPAVPAAHIFYNDGLGRFGVGVQASPRTPHVVLDQPARRKLGVAGVGDMNGDGLADVAAVYIDGDDGLRWIVYY